MRHSVSEAIPNVPKAKGECPQRSTPCFAKWEGRERVRPASLTLFILSSFLSLFLLSSLFWKVIIILPSKNDKPRRVSEPPSILHNVSGVGDVAAVVCRNVAKPGANAVSGAPTPC